MADTRIQPQGGSGTAPPTSARRVHDVELKALSDMLKLLDPLPAAIREQAIRFALKRYPLTEEKTG